MIYVDAYCSVGSGGWVGGLNVDGPQLTNRTEEANLSSRIRLILFLSTTITINLIAGVDDKLMTKSSM